MWREGIQRVAGTAIRAQGVPFLSNDSFGCQTQYIKAAIAYKTKVLGGSYSDSRIKKGRVLDSVAIEALGTVFEHGWL